MEERSKTGQKLKNSHMRCCLMRTCAHAMRPCAWGSLGYCPMCTCASLIRTCASL